MADDTDYLLGDQPLHWGKGDGSAVTITYKFSKDWTDDEKAAASAVFDLWSDVANVKFKQAQGATNIRLQKEDGPLLAWSNWTYDSQHKYTDFEINLNSKTPDSADWDPGSSWFSRLLHEVGHALGLKHPGDYEALAEGTGDDGPHIEDERDHVGTSVMSYHADPSASGLRPLGPMWLDILAVQRLYGANTKAAAGNDDYDLSRGLSAVYDTGGHDKLIAGDGAGPALIDLTGGRFSQLDGADRIYVMAGTVIEDAEGGQAADTIIGNDADNHLVGQGGADLLSGGEGDDRLFGNQSGDALDGGAGYDTLYGGRDEDTLDGGDGDDRLFGNRENDLLRGGAGDDVLYGGTDSDTLAGGAGVDTLVGGQGDDIFVFGAGDGADQIRDFVASVDHIVLLGIANPADGWQDDGDGNAVLDLGDGDSLTLVGHAAADIAADWFIV